jgi:hypothetical protein
MVQDPAGNSAAAPDWRVPQVRAAAKSAACGCSGGNAWRIQILVEIRSSVGREPEQKATLGRKHL